jgi:two-component system chemotaxis response regulator CheY
MTVPKHIEARLATVKILIVDDHHHMRKVVRTMLAALGVRTVYEASDGAAGLDAVVKLSPDVVIVDWDMPVINGLQFIQMVRSPDQFAVPDVPIILLTGHGDRWRVQEAARFGVHEFLLKPVSTKALLDRIIAALAPRQMMRFDGCYVPVPRKLVVLDADEKAGTDDVLLLS